MTAEEIRKRFEENREHIDSPTYRRHGETQRNAIMCAQLEFQVEIAAQLAELNVRLRETQVDTVMILKYVGDQMRGLNLAYEDFKKTFTTNGCIDVRSGGS